MESLKNKFVRLLLCLMLFITLIPNTRGNVFGQENGVGDKKDSNKYVQEQYTPILSESTATVKQTQSVQVTPEIKFVISKQNVAYIDSIVNNYLYRIEVNKQNKNEEDMINKSREAYTYLYLLPIIMVLSTIGIWIGNRVENGNVFMWLCVITFEIAFLLFLIKVPTFSLIL